ncbi:uncharacterized protein LOC143466176 [Clavelina lepadiformis]|uniref:uncharacterized protein LOC143466176 n=1 Tax=Clavelina lepadiformis TaxID=159417 RepID=UPI0040414B84
MIKQTRILWHFWCLTAPEIVTLLYECNNTDYWLDLNHTVRRKINEFKTSAQPDHSLISSVLATSHNTYRATLGNFMKLTLLAVGSGSGGPDLLEGKSPKLKHQWYVTDINGKLQNYFAYSDFVYKNTLTVTTYFRLFSSGIETQYYSCYVSFKAAYNRIPGLVAVLTIHCCGTTVIYTLHVLSPQGFAAFARLLIVCERTSCRPFYNEFWHQLHHEQFPHLKKETNRFISMFSTTYMCAQSFSAIKQIKSARRNRLLDTSLKNLLVATTKYFLPDLATSECKQFHSSH